MAPEAPTAGTIEPLLKKMCARLAASPQRQVEDHEAHVAEAVLDVVAEDPQEQHVAAEMPPPAVQEHRRQHRRPVRQRNERREIGGGRVLARHDAPGEDEGLDGLFRPVDLVQEGDDVQDDQCDRDERNAAVLVLVADWKHGIANPSSLIRNLSSLSLIPNPSIPQSRNPIRIASRPGRGLRTARGGSWGEEPFRELCHDGVVRIDDVRDADYAGLRGDLVGVHLVEAVVGDQPVDQLDVGDPEARRSAGGCCRRP